MELNELRGCGTALVTPFQAGGALDEQALRSLVRRQIEAGIDFLVPCGTTGESPVLDAEEHARVVEITLEEARGKVPVIAVRYMREREPTPTFTYLRRPAAAWAIVDNPAAAAPAPMSTVRRSNVSSLIFYSPG